MKETVLKKFEEIFGAVRAGRHVLYLPESFGENHRITIATRKGNAFNRKGCQL